MRISHLATVLAALAAGWYAATWYHAGAKQPAERRVLFYQSPMHPWVKADAPGQCTICGMDLVPIYAGEKGFGDGGEPVVMLPRGRASVVGLGTVEVTRRPLVRTLRVSGMIAEEEARRGIICAPVEGRIEALVLSHEGQVITRRQPLYTIYSRPLLAAAEEYRALAASGDPAAEKAARHLEDLGLVPEQILAIPQRQPDDKYFGIPAPLSGNILKTFVSPGQYVREGDRLFEIADCSTMAFHFDVYEQDLPFLKERQVIMVTVASLPGRAINARINSIAQNLDEVTHCARVRVLLENPDRALRRNAMAQGVIRIEDTDALALPRAAVLWPGGAPKVYVEVAPGTYRAQAVKLGRCGEKDYEVLEGLKAGDRVVTDGAVLLDSEAQMAE